MKTETKIHIQSMTQSVERGLDIITVFLGSLYIALLAQVEIPLVPIPVTLHTFAIFTLALFQGGQKALYSLLLYLLEATLGFPVFPGGYIDPFWIMGPSAGYCLGFPIAAYLIGKSIEHQGSGFKRRIVLGLCAGQAVIYLLGTAWLSLSLGWEQAWTVGLFPFLFFDFIKILTAFSIKMAATHLNYLYTNR